MHEPHRPPAIEAPGIFEGLSPRAILLGVIVDNLATLVSSLVLVSYFAARQGLGEDGKLSEEALEGLVASPGVPAREPRDGSRLHEPGRLRRCASRRKLLRPTRRLGRRRIRLDGIRDLSLSSGPGPSPPPLWLELAGYLLVVPAGVVGGLLAGARAKLW